MQMFPKFVAFDLETTGLSNAKDEIIEIGAVKFTLEEKNGQIVPKIIKEFQTFVKPNMMIPEEASRVNHITDQMVESAPTIGECLPKFTQFCGQDSILVAHNADFDAGFLRVAYQKNPQLIPANPVIDSLRIVRNIMPELPNHKLGELAMMFKRRNAITMNIAAGEMHRAVYDCEMLMEVLVATLKRRLKTTEWDMSMIMKVLPKYGGEPQYINKGK